MNGFSALAFKIIGIIAMLFVAYMIGEGSLDNRVTVLETNYLHIKETMTHIHDKVDRLLERE